MFDSAPPNLPTVGSGTGAPPASPAPVAPTATPAAQPASAPSVKPAGGTPLIQEEHVTVMPSKFFIPPKASLPWKKIGLVTLVVIVVGGAIVGISMLVQNRLGTNEPTPEIAKTSPSNSAPTPTPPDTSASNPPSTAPDSTAVKPSGQDPSTTGTAPVGSATGGASAAGTNSATNGTTTGAANTPTGTTTDTTATPPTVQADTKDSPLTAAVDTDTDAFSDSEEIVFGTDPSNPDTDQDGFSDGKEVLNLFSPNSPDSSKKIWETTIVNKYHHPSVGYELLYPSAWVARSTSSTGDEIVFTSPTGPSVTVSAVVNTQSVTAQQWYLSQHTDVSASQIKSVSTKSGLTGITSPTGLLTVFDVTSGGSRWFISIQYHAAGETVASYKQLYAMMVASFQIPTIKAFWNF
ncbi:hypothetical protein HZA86_00615 [Candidatus Uhrbacteria bacterium]|nr:hypothetical protein [Candidatus Uhrbacteria bacterium]